MELEEAISILEDENQEIFNFTTGVNKKWKEAYEMVIQVAKNSIPKEKVKLVLERKIKQLKDNPQYNWIGTEWSEEEVVEELKDIQKELLEE